MEQFDKDEIARYSRQLILPQFGVDAQARLRSARVLLVGLGGLGSPAALYLCGAGVGMLGLMDDSSASSGVDTSNLHRQIGYTEDDARHSRSKPHTLSEQLRQRNHHLDIHIHDTFITPENSVETCAGYSIVLDCTDNVRARYVVGDACAAAGVPLVSGAAIGLNGQLSVHVSDGCCYRCTFPRAPPPQCTGTCDSAGVLGPVPGIMGTLMALECIKLASKFDTAVPLIGKLLIFDAADGNMPFRVIKMRQSKRPECIACGAEDVRMDVKTYDYDGFLGVEKKKETNGAAEDAEQLPRISVNELDRIRKSKAAMLQLNGIHSANGVHAQNVQQEPYQCPTLDNGQKYVLIDVRPATEFAISRLKEAVNIPVQQVTEQAKTLAQALNGAQQGSQSDESAYQTIVICRRGNASRRALRALLDAGAQNVSDVVGGMEKYREIDSTLPMY